MADDAEVYDLEPASPSPSPVWILPRQSALVDLSREDVPCLNCGYNLRGLSPSGNCPECGVPIARSLQGNLLVFSSPEYVASLNRGLIFILLATVLYITFMVVAIVAMVLLRGSGVPAGIIEGLLLVISLPIAILSLLGWWLFSAPDVAIVGTDKGDTPRKVVRITVIISAVATVFSGFGAIAANVDPALEYVTGGINFLAGIAGIVQFFASMMYIRWLGPRLPDPDITTTANRYMWLLPLIFFVGLCVLIGPLIATLMYYLLLNRVRLQLKSIIERQAREFGALA